MLVLQSKTLRSRAGASLLVSLMAWLMFSMPLDAAEVYKVVDEQGRVTFTDSPPQGSKAEKVEILESNRLPPAPPRPAQPENQRQSAVPDYRLAITYPPNDFHVTPGIRDLDVEISVQPALRAGHRLELTDNGQVVPGRTLQNIVVRGTHVLLARIVDRDSNVVAESEPIQIHVHRPSVGGRRSGG